MIKFTKKAIVNADADKVWEYLHMDLMMLINGWHP